MTIAVRTFLIYLVILLSLPLMSNCDAMATSRVEPVMLFNLDYRDMQEIKKELEKGRDEIKKAYSRVMMKADSILSQTPHKVTDGDLPPTGDPHDFFTIGKYAHPNPETPDGLPYIRKDGIQNPEAFGPRYDLARYEETIRRVNTLALAWFYSEDEKYAAKAADILRVWFINPETRMNPNFECASALPGVYNGMAIGIIFGAQLVNFIDHIQLLGLSRSWTDEDNDNLKKWFVEYIDWLQTSQFGREISRSNNNMVTWYLAQIAAAAVYTGNRSLAGQMIERGREQVEEQISMNMEEFPDGSMPHEINRNQSFLYSVYGLQGFCALAGCVKAIGYDLWYYETEDGLGMRLAFDFLVPYLLEEKEWTRESLTPVKEQLPGSLSIVRQAEKAFKSRELKKTREHLEKLVESDSHVWLISK